MQPNEDVVKLTNAFITLPKKEVILAIILFNGIFFGILYSFFQNQDILFGAVRGFFLLSLPSLITAILMKLMVRTLIFRRVLALCFISELIYSFSYLTYIFLPISFSVKEVIIYIGAALAFIILYFISRAVFILKWKSFLFSLIQLFIYFLFLITSNAISGNFAMAKFLVSSLILLLFLQLFLFIINAPMKKNFGIPTMDVLTSFMAQWFYNSKELEKELKKISQKVITLFGCVIFKRKDDEIVLFFPYIHFGPFGNLGGSNFPYLIPKKIGKKGIVFHTTVTHDFDPVSSKEIDKLSEVFYKNYSKAKFRDVKVAYLSSICKSERCDALVFNHDILLSLTREPKMTEDLSFGLGRSLMLQAAKKWDNVFVVDQHNCETGEIVYYDVGSEVGENYLSSVKSLLSKKLHFSKLGVGYYETNLVGPFGPAGLKVLAITTKPKTIFLVFDANGITKEALNKLKSYLKDIDAKILIFTTDTHKVNKEKGVLNPIKDVESIKQEVKVAVNKALEDIKPAKYYSFIDKVAIDVIGSYQSSEIVSTINSIVAVVKIVAPIMLLGGVLSILYVTTKI